MKIAVLLRVLAGSAIPFLVTSCANAPTPSTDVVVTEKSFHCIRDMTKVRGFYVDNVLGDVAATVAAAKAEGGAPFPPGSVVQVIPTTAMVKHRPGHSPQTKDWEFIELDVKADGVKFLGRGYGELNMRNGANCLHCHEPARQKWDLICDRTKDCVPIPLSPAAMRGLQNSDPRCPKIALPRDEAEAFAKLGGTSAPQAAGK